MDKESYFELIRQHLEAKEFIVENKREINYGIQFRNSPRNAEGYL